MRSPRFWLIVLLLVMAAAFVHVRGDVDHVPPSEPLQDLPETLAGYSATELPLSPDVLKVMGKGVFLNRVYRPEIETNGATATPSAGDILLFIGYFPTQRTGQSIHSPQNCLPGSGWSFESSGTTNLTLPEGKTERVGEYVISDGINRAEVLYWYQSQGRSIASDYKAKLYMMVDSIRYGRTDAALVRVITPLRRGEDRMQAHRRAVAFSEQLAPLLPAYIPN
jgi:EpsI family protein